MPTKSIQGHSPDPSGPRTGKSLYRGCTRRAKRPVPDVFPVGEERGATTRQLVPHHYRLHAAVRFPRMLKPAPKVSSMIAGRM
jgi:hypothetical protein